MSTLKDRTIHTNTVEGAFSIFKRGMRGVYQHCAEQHLHRYLAEFEFRYNNRTANGVDDRQRAVNAVAGIAGKRLTYEGPNANAKAPTQLWLPGFNRGETGDGDRL